MKFTRFSIAILSVVVLAMVLLSGCLPKVKISTPSDPGDDLFLEADRLFRMHQYQKALEGFSKYLNQYPNGQLAPAALMKEGAIYTIRKQYRTAISVYQYLIDNFPSSPFVSDARAEILRLYYAQGRYEEALARGNAMLAAKHIHNREKVYRILGNCAIASGKRKQAVMYYLKELQFLVHPKDRNQTLRKMSEALQQMATNEIQDLIRTTDDPQAKGYLMYQLGINLLDDEKKDEATKVLAQFIEQLPDHEYVNPAKKLLKRLDMVPVFKRHSVGCLLPLSGKYRLYGNRAWRGIELALAQSGQSGSESFNIVLKDTQSNGEQAVTGVRELAREQVTAIIGPIATSVEAAREAQVQGIPQIVLTQKTDVPQIGENVFRNFITPQMQVNSLVAYTVQSLGLTRFAVLYPEEKYGTTFMKAFWDTVNRYGAQVTAVEAYSPELTDFKEPIKRLRGPGRHLDFDALFIPDGPRKSGLIIPQLAFYDVEKVRLMGTNLWYSPQFIHLAGRFAQGAIVPVGFYDASASQQVVDFIQAFTDTYGERPGTYNGVTYDNGFIEAVAYDTAKILFHIMASSGIRTRSAFRQALSHLENYPGITGTTSFDTSGEAVKALSLLVLKGKEFVEINQTRQMPYGQYQTRYLPELPSLDKPLLLWSPN